MGVNVIRINELPEGSGSLSNDDIFLFMDDPSNGGVTKKVSLTDMTNAIGLSDLVSGDGISLTYDNLNDSLVVTSSNISKVLSLGNISGSNAINFGTDRLIQNIVLNGTTVTFTKGTGWPTSNDTSCEIILKITVSTATSITWSVINEWYAQPPAGALSIGTHLFLLRANGTVIEGHYIGGKTN